MIYTIEFKPAAVRDLKSLDHQTQKRVGKKIDTLRSNPFPKSVKKLLGTDEEYYRIKTGPYRIIYQVQHEKVVVLIIRIRHRKEVYKGL